MRSSETRFRMNTQMSKYNKKKTHHKDHLQEFILYLYIKSSFLQLCNVCQRVSVPLAAFCYKLWHSVRCVPWSHTKGDVFKTVKDNILLIQQDILITWLTLNIQGPSYLGLTRSIPWLLISWLLASPGHQQPWYWLRTMGRSLSYLRKDFNHLCHINVEERQKM